MTEKKRRLTVGVEEESLTTNGKKMNRKGKEVGEAGGETQWDVRPKM